jgi:hypothetical protein
MREYHVDSHPSFKSYVNNENEVHGGNLSVRFPDNRRPVIRIGQDESSFSQNSFSSRSWKGLEVKEHSYCQKVMVKQ